MLLLLCCWRRSTCVTSLESHDCQAARSSISRKGSSKSSSRRRISMTLATFAKVKKENSFTSTVLHCGLYHYLSCGFCGIVLYFFVFENVCLFCICINVLM